MQKVIFLLCILFLRVSAWSYDATPFCFHELESTFFNRIIVTQGLSYTDIQQGLWERIIQDLRAKTPYIHQEVRRLGSQKKRNPTDYPFRMKESKDLLLIVLFRIFDDTMRQNKYVLNDEGDIARVFNFLRSATQKQWDMCK